MTEDISAGASARARRPGDALVRITGVTKRYGSRGRPALDDVKLDVAHGEAVAVMGPSGSGKSTLLNLIAGLDRPTSGTVTVAGRRIDTLSETRLARYRRRQVAMIFQFFNLLEDLTVLDNVLMPAQLAGLRRSKARARADELLATLGIDRYRNAYPGRLSGGERQRVAIARALVKALDKVSRSINSFLMKENDFAPVTTPEQFKALGHPMRHRLLFALGQGQATISQLAVALGSNKGNIAHHLKVLAGAGLVRPSGTRQVRGGTEQYYQRAVRGLKYDDAETVEVAFCALAAEIAAAEPEPFLVLRTLRLTPEHAMQLTATLRDLADQDEDPSDQPRYGLLVGLYQR